MGTTAVNLQGRADRLVELAHALELATQNHKWEEAGAVLSGMLAEIAEGFVNLTTIDPEMVKLMYVEARRIVDELEDRLRESQQADAGTPSGGTVSDEPTLPPTNPETRSRLPQPPKPNKTD